MSPASAQEAAVYKWVDAEGVPHYSDQPPSGVVAEQTVIRYRKTDTGIVQSKGKAEPASGEQAENADEAAPDPKAEADERQRNLDARTAGCEQAKARMAKYEEARRIYRPGPNGERIYLTDEEIDAERANARRAVGDWCGEE